MQTFRDVLSRWERKELSAMEAGELLGCSERQFRRYRRRYEEEGLAGLVDRRLGKASLRRVPVDKLVWMLGAYRTRAARGGAHRRKRPRKPCEGMMLHQDGSRFAWLSGSPELDLIVTMDDINHRMVQRPPMSGKRYIRTMVPTRYLCNQLTGCSLALAPGARNQVIGADLFRPHADFDWHREPTATMMMAPTMMTLGDVARARLFYERMADLQSGVGADSLAALAPALATRPRRRPGRRGSGGLDRRDAVGIFWKPNLLSESPSPQPPSR
jgi:hypothetical protein